MNEKDNNRDNKYIILILFVMMVGLALGMITRQITNPDHNTNNSEMTYPMRETLHKVINHK